MNLVDVHIHLDFEDYVKDIDAFIKLQEDNNVKAIIANGVGFDSNLKVLDLAKKFKVVRPALGMYPTDHQSFSFEKLDEDFDFIKKNKEVVGYGEVGLDFKNLDEGKEEGQVKAQKYLFEKFISLSEKTKKPLIIHSRKAELEVLEMLESSTLKNPVLHCFMGKKKYVKKGLDLGYNFSILPTVTKSQQLKDIVVNASINQLLTETDGPYMSPFDFPSEPRYVFESIKEIAKLKNLEVEEVANIVFFNYLKLFKNQ